MRVTSCGISYLNRRTSPNEIIIDETLSDSLLGLAEDDIEGSDVEFELTDEVDDLTFDIIEEDTVDLQLESSLDGGFTGESADADAIIELDINGSLGLDQEDSNDLDFSFDMEEEDSQETAPEVAHNLQADLEETEFYIQQGLYAEAKKLCNDILVYDPDSAECRQKLEEIEALLSREKEQSVVVMKTPSSSSSSDDSVDIDFDLDSLRPDEAAEKKIFKTDVDEQIAADDMESHYNLGIAYREMGLLDDAISEFEKAEKEPSRYVDCQI